MLNGRTSTMLTGKTTGFIAMVQPHALGRCAAMSMIHVTLPDGTVNEYAAGITCSEVVTDALGKNTAALRQRSTVLNGT